MICTALNQVLKKFGKVRAPKCLLPERGSYERLAPHRFLRTAARNLQSSARLASTLPDAKEWETVGDVIMYIILYAAVFLLAFGNPQRANSCAGWNLAISSHLMFCFCVCKSWYLTRWPVFDLATKKLTCPKHRIHRVNTTITHTKLRINADEKYMFGCLCEYCLVVCICVCHTVSWHAVEFYDHPRRSALQDVQ